MPRTGSTNFISTDCASTRRSRSSTSRSPRPRRNHAHARARPPAAVDHLVAENEPQDVRGLRSPSERGFGFDALWNDDFHHAAIVALTGHREAYYTDYLGCPQEFVSCAKRGFLYQGQRYSWQRARRGTPTLGFAPERFITFLENHDQIANAPSGRGARVHQQTSPGLYRAMTALWLLSPGTPMFFQGQEFAASSPFLYFADHGGDLGAAVRSGRAEFMSQFRSAATRPLVETLPDPRDRGPFARCKLDHAERERACAHGRPASRPAATAAGDCVRCAGRIVIRRRGPVGPRVRPAMVFARRPPMRRLEHGDRLLIVNLGAELSLTTLPEPLLAPPTAAGWTIRWSSEDPAYGGAGTAPVETDDGWRIPGQAAVLLASVCSHDGGLSVRRRLIRPAPDPTRRRACARQRVAGHERPRRLCVGNAFRHSDAALSRSARRGLAGAGRPHGDAQPCRRAAATAVRARSCRSIPNRGRSTPARLTKRKAADARRVPAGSRLADMALRRQRLRDRETRADALSAEHRSRHVSASSTRAARSGSNCARSCTFAITKARSPIRCRTPTP